MLPWSSKSNVIWATKSLDQPVSINVAVAQNSFQRIITEHFDLAGADSRQEMVIGGQRYHRVTAQSGSVELVYKAVVEATHELFGDPSRLQVPLFEQIPAEALIFIYPSRFC